MAQVWLVNRCRTAEIVSLLRPKLVNRTRPKTRSNRMPKGKAVAPERKTKRAQVPRLCYQASEPSLNPSSPLRGFRRLNLSQAAIDGQLDTSYIVAVVGG